MNPEILLQLSQEIQDLNTLENSNSLLDNSLFDFYNSVVSSRLSGLPAHVLDIGCGSFSLFENIPHEKSEIVAIDFSPTAIKKAPASSIAYHLCDISDKDFLKIFSKNYFNLIFDSHCFHCIVDQTKREQAFKNVYDTLALDGYFCAEMMVQPAGQYIDAENRFIPESRELEDELVKAGFRIKYFVICRDLIFELNSERGINCDLVRVVVTK